MSHIRTLKELNEVGIENVELVDVFKQSDDRPSKLDTDLVVLVVGGSHYYVNPTSELFYDYVRDENGGFTNSHYIYDIEGRFADSGNYCRWKKIDGGTAYIAYPKPKEENEPVFNSEYNYMVRYSGRISPFCGRCLASDIERVTEIMKITDSMCNGCGKKPDVVGTMSLSEMQNQKEAMTAANLLQKLDRDYWYHDNIVRSASKMVDLGMGQWVYYDQWGSGDCVWRSPCDRFGGHLDMYSGTFKR